MPLGDLRTQTNMGGVIKQDESWKPYEHEVTPAKPVLQPLAHTPPAGRGVGNPEPKVVEKNLATGKQTRKRSTKPKVSDEKLEAANEKDLKKRNIKPRKPKTTKVTPETQSEENE